MNMIFSVLFWSVWIFCGCSCSLSVTESSQKNLPTETIHHENTDSSLSQNSRYETWVFSLLASCIIGFSGIVPLILIPLEITVGFGKGKGDDKPLRLLLSFAVGGLLGDVFLHLLPEAWNIRKFYEHGQMSIGLWVLLGMFSFVVIEIMFTASDHASKERLALEAKKTTQLKDSNVIGSSKAFSNQFSEPHQQNCLLRVNITQNGCGNSHSENQKAVLAKDEQKHDTIHITGYLNLMANGIDNFTHGLAVAASFLVSCKMGVLTTFAILIHEIPHEIGDFAILMRSGFRPWAAAKAQVSTATIGIIGAVVALSAESVDQVNVCTSWILPFTAGGFLNIALVNVLPDLLKESDPWESIKQLVCLCAGIGVMAVVSFAV